MSADDIFSWANWVLVAALVLGVLATYAIVVSGNIKESALRRELAIAGTTAETAKEDAARANERAEQLRVDNLALQKLIQPRRLEPLVLLSSPDEPNRPPPVERQFAGIRSFEGTPVLLQVVPDFEAQTLARDMFAVITAFGWKPQIVDERLSHLSPLAMLPGVKITYPSDSKYVAAATALADAFTKAGLDGTMDLGSNRVIARGYPANPNGTPAVNVPGYPNFNPPIDAVIVLVGMKPMTIRPNRMHD